MSSLEQSMETLTSQWYNAVVTGCGFDPETFQLVQGNQAVGSTSEKLWQFFDTVPPLTISNYFNPTSFNSFSQDYGGVVAHIIPQGGDALQTAMGDYYSQWQSYSKKNQDYGIKAFQTWAMGVNPSQAADWISLYRTLLDGAVFLAQQAWDNMLNAESNPGVCAFDKTINDLNSALQSSASKTVHMDSSTESSDVSNSWSEGSVEGIFEDFFEGAGEGSYSDFSKTVTSAGLTIDAEFTRLTTIAAAPLYQPSSDSILSQYTPWYNSEALSIAYKNNNNEVWKHGAPTWDGTFGDAGDMTRMCGGIVVVDGISITVTSSASISKNDQQKFEAAAAGGFFPFFMAEAAHGWSTDTSFNDSGQASMTVSSKLGNPQVLGVIVTPMGQVLA